jgi:hypothetical protein
LAGSWNADFAAIHGGAVARPFETHHNSLDNSSTCSANRLYLETTDYWQADQVWVQENVP